MQEDDPENSDMPKDAALAADQTRHFSKPSTGSGADESSSGSAAAPAAPAGEKRTLSKTIKGAIFREVVLAKVREMKEQEETLKVTGEAQESSKTL